MEYKDITESQYEHLRKMRNEAGQYIANNEFDKAFEGILDIKRDIKKRQLHPSTFDNILDEIIAIGCELSEEKEVTLVKFGRFLKVNYYRLIQV